MSKIICRKTEKKSPPFQGEDLGVIKMQVLLFHLLLVENKYCPTMPGPFLKRRGELLNRLIIK